MAEKSPIHILVAEDDDVDMLGIERALKSIRLSNPVTRAIDGVEAWDRIIDADGQARDDLPGIILLDLNMPRMTGHEFLEKFFNLDPVPDCDVFVLTTSDTDKDILKAYKYGVKGYLLKSDLVGGLREAIAGLEKDWVIVSR